ncbi:hypothetical protein EJ04DRAFT_516660 [Polyplosphaeria fusca]|uniref:Uncharacterized protein n=1 Tax=Polyplosphaeria fusca TaxID=682080 RepID=A0A9P4UU02_9PLEO|nr:hypothetical protein EJ04DRAFT_516660 [Polyplosphaeria fusca]
MLGSSEPRRRKKDPDRERSSKDRDKDRDERKERHKSRSSRSSRKTSSSATSKDDDRESERPREHSSRERIRTSSSSHATPTLNRMAIVPEMERRGSLGSPNASKTSLPYPSYSKTHSKENIYARGEAPERRKSPFTPEATDVGDEAGSKDQGDTRAAGAMPSPSRAPPSPPLTATTAADLRKTASVNSMRRKGSEAIAKEMEPGRRSVDSGTRLTPDPRFAASRSSVREELQEGTDLTSTTGSQPSTVRQKASNPKLAPPKARTASPSTARTSGKEATTTASSSRHGSEITQSTASDATSVPPEHQHARGERVPSPSNSGSSPASLVDSSPRTPTQHSVLPSVVSAAKDSRPPTVEYVVDDSSRAQSVDPTFADPALTPPPPPPPPALVDAPRVDYLLQNGGLSRPVPRSLLAAIDNTPAMSYSSYSSPRVAGPQLHDAKELFSNLQHLLNSYTLVMDRSGSIAVATGYRSVARRLLDRLEHVFARNITAEHCQCYMCVYKPSPVLLDERLFAVNDKDASGLNWGAVLELVCGRRELPPWPPGDRKTATGLGIAPSTLADPCQNIDVDVPEQYREHYVRQAEKTKTAVQSWLSEQQDSSPEEADDETLTFSMITQLQVELRPLFYAVLYGLQYMPTPKSAPVPDTGTPPTVQKAALGLQRLYRLAKLPRDQVVAMYLIQNPHIHDYLATLAAISAQEWEILISGRFDGFLWSGAEDPSTVTSPPPAPVPSRGPSRGPSAQLPTMSPEPPRSFPTPMLGAPPTPIFGARPTSTRPGSGAPVQIDEDTEVAVLAEVEREIFHGMEALEDAFEHLHNSAEIVRRRLRERGAALAMSAQARRGSAMGGIEVRMDTPASLAGAMDLDLEALQHLRSDIGPDDSASMVSHNRRGRGHRARARRTPAPVEEQKEEELVETLAERIRRKF